MKFILAAITFLFSIGHAQTLPSSVVGNWVQLNGDTPRDRFILSQEGAFVQIQRREVGQYGTYIPYPTTCTYRESTKIQSLGPASAKTVQHYLAFRRKPPTHTVSYEVTHVELIPVKDNDPYCKDWAAQENYYVRQGMAHGDWSFALRSDGKIEDTWREVLFGRENL